MVSSVFPIPEILLEILSYISHPESLSACARVCRAWKDPALSQLWSLDPDPLTRIISVMWPDPRPMWRPFSFKDIERWSYYSKFITGLNIHFESLEQKYDRKISQFFHDTISIRQFYTLMPNLRVLDIESSNAEISIAALSLISPATKTIRISTMYLYSSSEFEHMLAVLVHAAPHLETLSLGMRLNMIEQHSANIALLIRQHVPKFRSLRRLSLPRDMEFSLCLALIHQMPSLELYADLSDGKIQQRPGMQTALVDKQLCMERKVGFLNTLALSRRYDELLEAFSQEPFSNGNLQDVTLSIRSRTCTGKQIRALVEKLIRWPQLEVLCLAFSNLEGSSTQQLELNLVNPESITKDGPLRSLKWLRLHASSAFSIKQTGLKRLAYAFPNLRVLELLDGTNNSSFGQQEPCTVNDLSKVASKFRHLQKLAINLTASSDGLGDRPMPFPSLMECDLRTVSNGNSVHDVKMAQTLAWLLPMKCKIIVRKTHGSPYPTIPEDTHPLAVTIELFRATIMKERGEISSVHKEPANPLFTTSPLSSPNIVSSKKRHRPSSGYST